MPAEVLSFYKEGEARCLHPLVNLSGLFETKIEAGLSRRDAAFAETQPRTLQTRVLLRFHEGHDRKLTEITDNTANVTDRQSLV